MLIKIVQVDKVEKCKRRIVIPRMTIIRDINGSAMAVRDIVVASSFTELDFASHDKKVYKASHLFQVFDFIVRNADKQPIVHVGDKTRIRRSVLLALLRKRGCDSYRVGVRVMDNIESLIFNGNSIVTLGNDCFTLKVSFNPTPNSQYMVVDIGDVEMTSAPMMVVKPKVWYQHPYLTVDLGYVNRKLKELRWRSQKTRVS
jgi:hypothetical protein